MMVHKAVLVTVSLRKHRVHLEDFSKPNGGFGQDLSHLQSLCRTATQRDKERNRKGREIMGEQEEEGDKQVKWRKRRNRNEAGGQAMAKAQARHLGGESRRIRSSQGDP